MADDNDRPRTDVQDHAAAQQAPVSETRRTSTSSAGMSTGGREPARPSSMHASVASIQSGQPSESTRKAKARGPLDYGSIQSSSSSSRPALASQSSQTPKRPMVDRRTSAAPHRGEKFSVDDDPDEVDDDFRLTRKLSKQEQKQKDRDRERPLPKTRDSTVRRRPAAQAPALTRVVSEDAEEGAQSTGSDPANRPVKTIETDGAPGSDETLHDGEEEEEEQEEEEEEDDSSTPSPDDDLSDAESFTLKDRQEAINETHPFGIRIWKPALYKKNRSVQRNAEGDIHSAPGGHVSRWGWIANASWTVIFGWWLALITATGGGVCMVLSAFQFPGCRAYGRVMINLAHYLFYPFGMYVRLEHDEAYLDEDEGEGRSITEYEQWQTGDIEHGRLFFGPIGINRSIIGRRRDDVEDPPPDENDPLLTRSGRQNSVSERARTRTKKRFFGRGKWDIGRVVFFLSFYVFIAPCLFIVSGICWFLVFSIPMGKVTLLLFYHMRRHPLALSFHTDSHYQGHNQNIPRGSKGSVILLCTYRAVGWKYWKYTIDGTNIFLINLLSLVVFAIFDYFVLYEALGVRTWLTSPALVFILALASIIPLAYFIGQAVASISAQSSMGVGATINAFFSTVVEVFLYCVALTQGKGQLVEGSIVGSIFAGILFLPGLSMCFGALKRKTQRFNVKSAGVTSTMLLFAVIGAFGPTLFYQIYGSHELNCHQCVENGGPIEDRDCRRCYFAQVPAVTDEFFHKAVKPYIWFATVCLFLSYLVGLMFTLRTHAAVIWNNESEEKKDDKKDPKIDHTGHHHDEHRHGSIIPGTAGLIIQDEPRPSPSRTNTTGTLNRENIRDSQMYKRILNQSLKQAGISAARDAENTSAAAKDDGQTPHLVPPKSSDGESAGLQGLSLEDNRALVQQVAEMAATAAAVATRDTTRNPKKTAQMSSTGSGRHHKNKDGHRNLTGDMPMGSAPKPAAEGGAPEEAAGGHDAPNWSRTKSAVILLTATVAYAIIAEILVDTVDAVLTNVDIDEKFLGFTLFALVPNTTEFLNAISFAMNGNVALSMEIGSSYALQVMLLQIPALVLFSAFYTNYIPQEDVMDYTFNLLFPQWDMVTVILGVFLMGWVVGEGKSNYFKGSILIFTYLVVVVGFYFVGYNDMDTMGINRFDTLAVGSTSQTFRTIGRPKAGRAY